MQIRRDNCENQYKATWKAVEDCHSCENFSNSSPRSITDRGQKYLVRMSELRYGEVTVWAESEEEAKTAAIGEEIMFYDSEITDMTAELVGKGENG